MRWVQWGATLALWILSLTPAFAAVSIRDEVLQTGRFEVKDCKPETPDAPYNECACEADVHYPVLSGLADPAGAKLNAFFKEYASKLGCGGAPAKADPEDERSPNGAGLGFKTVYQSGSLLSLLFEKYSYGAGAAHPNTVPEAFVIDTQSGHIYSLTEVIAAKDIPAINAAIFEELNRRPEGEVFKEQLPEKKDRFIKDGACNGCTFYVRRDGLVILFRPYEVGPYVSGPIEVVLAGKFIANAALTKLLETKSP